MKRLKRFLLLNDWLWSPLLAFALFTAVGAVLQWAYATEDGSAVGIYDPSFWQAAVYSAGVVVLFSGAASLGLSVNFRGYWRYIYQRESRIREDFKQLTPWQKFFISHFWLCFYTLAMLAVFTLLV